MIIYSVYLILNGGRPLLIEEFHASPNKTNEILLCGLLTTIQVLSEELTGVSGSAEKFQLIGLVYHLRTFGMFQVVIASSSEDSPEEAIHKIGWQFLKSYGDVLENWKGDQQQFNDFRKVIQRIIKSEFYIDLSNSLDPAKRLDTTSIFNLPKSLQ